MRLPLFVPLAVSILAGVSFAQASAQLPEAKFTIVQASDGKTVGSAAFSVASLGNAYQVSSHGQMSLQKFSYSFSNSNRIDLQLNIIRDQLTGTVNGEQVTFDLASDSTGRQFLANIGAKGQNTQNNFDRHQHAVLLPDLDPAAYMEMAHFALEHPATAWIVIPKQNGLLVPAMYNPQPDVQATFQGQPITVHHTSVEISGENSISVEIYYRSSGTIYEADLPEQNFYVIRDGFRLDNRPRYVPPRNNAPPPTQQSQGQQPPQYSMPQGAPQPQIQPEALVQSY